MIIGNGMMSKRFGSYAQNEKVIIFASGVSNSSETREEMFDKEFQLLRTKINENRDKLLIYFSTCSVYDRSAAKTKYVKHKRFIEDFIKIEAKQYILFRLPQVVGRTENPYTLTNYLFNKIKNNKHFQIWSGSRRNIIDLDDVYFFITNIIENEEYVNETVNLSTPFWVNVIDIVRIFEEILCVNANYVCVNMGEPYSVDNEYMKALCKDYNFIFNEDYNRRLLYKYYGNGDSSAAD